ncbi:hypothetical protein [Actinokineospora sp.]|uniref:hypothetical protein n=1 Tax=Actinokineospora sp. TaxID=1872133 RepID=UPI003D6A6A72
MSRSLAVGAVGAVGAGLTGIYLGLVTAAAPLDLGVGRRTRPLGPQTIDIRATREVVFDVLAEPYLGRTTRAMAGKLTVLERGSDMVLAAHRTPVSRGPVAITVETVRFTRPDRIDFRLVRGPVPQVSEQFLLTDQPFGTRLRYEGELGTDLWALGQWWGAAVACRWEQVVADTFRDVRAEAERRADRQ